MVARNTRECVLLMEHYCKFRFLIIFIHRSAMSSASDRSCPGDEGRMWNKSLQEVVARMDETPLSIKKPGTVSPITSPILVARSPVSYMPRVLSSVHNLSSMDVVFELCENNEAISKLRFIPSVYVVSQYLNIPRLLYSTTISIGHPSMRVVIFPDVFLAFVLRFSS